MKYRGNRIFRNVALLLLIICLSFSNFDFITWGDSFSKLIASTKVQDTKAQEAKNSSTEIGLGRDKTEFLIKYKNTANKDKIKNGVKSKFKLKQFKTKRELKNHKIDVVEIDEDSNINQVIEEIKKSPDVEYVQPNYKLEGYGLPVDPMFKEQWALQNTGQVIDVQEGRVGVDINAIKAWDVTKGSASVVVGVLDTGIDINHEDLKNNIYVNKKEIPGNGLDDDGNGYIDDVNGWDFANNDNTVFDSDNSDFHGTAVAGIIAAESNDKGVTGVAPGVKILPLKFIHDGAGYTDDIIEAIEYAKAMGIQVINCSFGGRDNNQALKEAMQSSGILFVCAAGNRGENVAEKPIYPACFDIPNILSVASIDYMGVLSSFSCYGEAIDVAAPGIDILSTFPGNKYWKISGTSMSAAYATGAVALLKSKLAGLTNTQIISRIKDNVIPSTKLTGKIESGGRIDAYAALSDKQPAADQYNGNGIASTYIIPGDQGSGDDSWYAMSETSLIEERLHYGENGVSPKSGNFSITCDDETITVPGFELNISRTYNLKETMCVQSFGRGWTFGFDGTVVSPGFYEGSNAIVYFPNGSSELFRFKGFNQSNVGEYTPVYSGSILTYNANSDGYTLKTKDGYQYYFKNGLTGIQDKNGNTIQINRDTQGYIKTIMDPLGRIYTVTYNSRLRIDNIVDPMGKVIKYQYDNGTISTCQLVSVTDAVGNKMYYSYSSDTASDTGKFRIDDGNRKRIAEIVYQDNIYQVGRRVKSAVDYYGNTYSYLYAIDTNAYIVAGPKGNRTTITDSSGRQWAYAYPTNYQSFYPSVCPPGTAEVYSVFDPDGVETINFFDRYGQKIKMMDRNGNKTEYIRDNYGNILKTINPDLSFKEAQYDTYNNMIYEKDEAGRGTYYIYDSKKANLVKKAQPLNGTDVYTAGCDESKFAVTNYTYYTPTETQSLFGCSVGGLLKNITDPEGRITTYTYDKYGNRKTVSDPETGKVTTYEYNNNAAVNIGWKTAEISPKGFRTEYQYNANGQLEKTIQKNGETTRLVYDVNGYKTKEVSPNLYNPALEDTVNKTYTGNHGYRYTYYDSGKVWTVTDPENNVTEYTYDLYGNKLTEKKPNGAIYRYTYDNVNRLIGEYFRDSAAAPESLLKTYTYEILKGKGYGSTPTPGYVLNIPDSRLKKTETRYFNATDKAVTVYIYDYADRLLEQQNPDGSTVNTGYNVNGTIASKTEANGGTTYYSYDVFNRVSGQWVPIENNSGTVYYAYTEFTYDKADNKITEKIGQEKVTYPNKPATYIVKNYTYYKNNKLKTVTIDGKLRNEYHYDDDSNLDWEKTYTDGTSYVLTEYVNNYLDKQDSRKVHVRKGDIADNVDTDNTDLVLETAYTYDKNGNLKTEKTPNNVTTTYTYDNMNRQTGTSQPGTDENGAAVSIVTSTTYNWEGKTLTKTDANSNVTTYYYTQSGNIDRIVDAAGGTTKYYYDTGNRKIAEVSPKYYDSTKSIDQMNRKVYEYDSMDRVITEKDIYQQPTTNVWITINTKSYKYDAGGNVVKELDALGYKAGTGTTTVQKIDSGYGIEYTYNLADKLVTKLDPVSKDRGLAYTLRNEYDALGQKITETNAKGVITKYDYDSTGNIISTKVKKNSGAPEQVINSATYDYSGRKLIETDGNGNVTTYEYNALGKVRKLAMPGDSTIPASTIKQQYDVLGNLAKATDTVGAADTFTYDNQGRQLSHSRTYPGDSKTITTSVKYDKNGNKRFEFDGNSTKKEYVYNNLNKLVAEKLTVNGKLKQTGYIYDKNGNQETMTDWTGNIYTNVYDHLNRLIEKKDPYTTIQKLEYYDNHLQSMTVDALGNITEYRYDKNNRLLQTIDPERHSTSQTYDNEGNVESKKDGKNNTTTFAYDEFNRLTTVTNAKDEVTSYAYDGNGNMLTQIDGKGNIVTCEYNAANKLAKRIDHGGRTGAEGNYQYDARKVESYTYYADGQLKTKTDRNGNITTYTYDAQGKIQSLQIGTITISYTYDGNGNMLTMTDETGTTTRTYDEENRVKTKNVPGIGLETYNYDLVESDLSGQSVSIESGCCAEQSVDAKGNSTVKVYDKANRLNKVIADGQTTTYEYYDNGNRKYIIYPDSSKEEYVYYNDDLIRTLTNKKADGTVIDQYSYAYDAAHNQISKTDKKGSTAYTYDNLNRLETVTEPGGKLTKYSFDKAGNREKEEVTSGASTETTDYSYNEQNRLMSTTKHQGNQMEIVAYSYDDNGNMLSSIKQLVDTDGYTDREAISIAVNGDSGTSIYTYDELNRMTAVSTDGQTTSYKYNGDGLRVEKEQNGSITKYLYESDKVVLELDGSGNQIARTIQGINTISRTVSGQKVFYMYNGHADVTALLDGTGNIVGTYYYDAFGNIAEQSGTIDNPFKYANYMFDDESGLYYLNSRYYDPKIARFITEDTYRGEPNDPLSLNLYAYCHNEPIMYTDPTGHKPSGTSEETDREARKSLIDEYKTAGKERRTEIVAEVAKLDKNTVAKTQKTIDSMMDDYAKSSMKNGKNIEIRAAKASNKINVADPKQADKYKTGPNASLANIGNNKGTGNSGNPVNNVIDFVLPGTSERAANSLKSPYDFANYALAGFPDRISENIKVGTERPLSVEHWVGALGVILDVMPQTKGEEQLAKAGGEVLENLIKNDIGKWSSEKGIYEVGYEVRLQQGVDYPNVSDARHFQEANKQLHDAFTVDPEFARNMDAVYPGIVDGVKPGSKGAFPRRAPTADVTWHHNPFEEGLLQLVPRDQHGASGFIQSILHPGGQGGMQIWGGGR